MCVRARKRRYRSLFSQALNVCVGVHVEYIAHQVAGSKEGRRGSGVQSWQEQRRAPILYRGNRAGVHIVCHISDTVQSDLYCSSPGSIAHTHCVWLSVALLCVLLGTRD